MPTSNDNQDYGESDEKNMDKSSAPDSNKMTADDLKGKKVDADLTEKSDKPAEQEK